MRRLAAAAALALALPAAAAETLAVVAVADPPAGPDADLAELAHQLRAACRDRVGGVLDVPSMRVRLLGLSSNATLAELDRAYGGALAVYQNGEFESAIRTLQAIVEDLEALPESEEAYAQWTRALLRLAHAAGTIGRRDLADESLVKLLMVDPGFQADADQYSPAYRRRLEELRARVRALPRRTLSVVSEGRIGTVFVNGRPSGRTPATLVLPAGTFRVGGAAGSLRVPSFSVDLTEEDRTVALDFALSESLRPNAGPGLALGGDRRGHGIIRAGAWLGVDRLLVTSRAAEGDALFLLGSIYDVRRGALLREGSVRMVAGTVPSVNLGALAAFLLTGQSSREVKDRTLEGRRLLPPVSALPPEVDAASGAVGSAAAPPRPSAEPAPAPAPAPAAPAADLRPPAPDPRPAVAVADPAVAAPGAVAPQRTWLPGGRWMRPAAFGAGALAIGFAGLAVQQGVAASRAYDEADAMLGEGGVFLPGSDPSRYHDLRESGDASRRNAYAAAGGAVVFAAAAGVLGWLSRDGRAAAPVLRF
jgi:hypothetical protein